MQRQSSTPKQLTREASQSPHGGHDVLTDEREGAQHLLVVTGDVAHHDLLKTQRPVVPEPLDDRLRASH